MCFTQIKKNHHNGRKTQDFIMQTISATSDCTKNSAVANLEGDRQIGRFRMTLTLFPVKYISSVGESCHSLKAEISGFMISDLGSYFLLLLLLLLIVLFSRNFIKDCEDNISTYERNYIIFYFKTWPLSGFLKMTLYVRLHNNYGFTFNFVE